MPNLTFTFDLQKMDWSSPHGKGIRDDVYICVNDAFSETNGYIEPDTMTIEFKHKDEGLYIVDKDLFSEFGSVYHANVKSPYRLY